MSLTYNGRIVAEAVVQSVNGRAAIGGYLIAFSVRIDTVAWKDPADACLLLGWFGEVSASRKASISKVLGRAWPEGAVALRTFDFANTTYVSFNVELSSAQVAFLEEERAGGELQFQIRICAQCELATVQPHDVLEHSHLVRQVLAVQDELRCDLSLSQWATVLEQFGYRQLVVFTLSFPFDIKRTLEPARQLVLKAQQLFLQGDYEGVVAISRTILESVSTALDEDGQLVAARKKHRQGADRESMSKKERSLLVQDAVRNYTHLAHHVQKDDGGVQWYSRTDATFTLALAIAVFAEAAERGA